jgi:hypothetical protein
VRPGTSAAQHQGLALPCFRLVSRAETKETQGKSNQAIGIARGAFPKTRTLVLCAARFLLSLPLPLLPHLPPPYRIVPIETHNSHCRFLSSTRAPTTQAAPLACLPGYDYRTESFVLGYSCTRPTPMPTRGTGVCTHVAIDELRSSAWRGVVWHGMAHKLRLYRGVARTCGVRVGVEHPCVSVCVLGVACNYFHGSNDSPL